MRFALVVICGCGACTAAAPMVDSGADATPACEARPIDLLVVKGLGNSDVDAALCLTYVVGPAFEASLPLPDVRVGVVTSNLGSFGSTLWNCPGVAGDSLVGDGALLVRANLDSCYWCSAPDILGQPDWPELLSLDTVAPRGGTAVGQAVTCAIACSGPANERCEITQHLEAAARAPAANPGFVRDGSVLGILIIAAYDDFSTADPALWDAAHLAEARCFLGYRSPEYLVPVQDYVARLKEIHPGPIVVGVLGAGGTSMVGPSGCEGAVCNSCQVTERLPTPRLVELTGYSESGACPAFSALWLDYCAADLTAEVKRFLGALKAAAGLAP